MRGERLLKIILHLQNNIRITSKELAEKLEVSERTIHRDMESLSTAGIPVVAERGAGGGWSLLDGYRTRLTGMNNEEIQSLLYLGHSQIAADLGLQKSLENALLKLNASLPHSLLGDAHYVKERIHIDGAGWHQSSEHNPFLPMIQDAVWQQHKLIIDYTKDSGLSRREVLPLGLVAKGKLWYLIAEMEHSIRSYRISRIANVENTGAFFERPPNFHLATYWEQSIASFLSALPKYSAKLRLHRKLLQRTDRMPYIKIEQIIEEYEEYIVALVRFDTLESACEIMLSLGEHAEALEPLELRSTIRDAALAVAERHKL